MNFSIAPRLEVEAEEEEEKEEEEEEEEEAATITAPIFVPPCRSNLPLSLPLLSLSWTYGSPTGPADWRRDRWARARERATVKAWEGVGRGPGEGRGEEEEGFGRKGQVRMTRKKEKLRECVFFQGRTTYTLCSNVDRSGKVSRGVVKVSGVREELVLGEVGI